MAFQLTLALVPFLIVVGAVASSVDRLFDLDLAGRIIDALQSDAPAGARELLGPEVERVLGAHPVGLLSIGLPLSIYAASSAISTLIAALDDAYEVHERRSALWRRLIALALTVSLSIAIVIGFVLTVFGARLGEWVSENAGLADYWTPAWRILRLVFAGGFVLLAFDYVYWLAPNTGDRFRWATPGSIFATLGWLLATEGFALYVESAGEFSATYGSIGAAIALLFWFDITSYVILIGGEINALFAFLRTRRTSPYGDASIA